MPQKRHVGDSGTTWWWLGGTLLTTLRQPNNNLGTFYDYDLRTTWLWLRSDLVTSKTSWFRSDLYKTQKRSADDSGLTWWFGDDYVRTYEHFTDDPWVTWKRIVDFFWTMKSQGRLSEDLGTTLITLNGSERCRQLTKGKMIRKFLEDSGLLWL